jgi:two-component system, NarL family, nitrate/nitrite response regulator NarL
MSAPNGTWPQEAIADPVTAEVDDRPLRVLVADYDGLARAMMRAALNDADRIAIVLSAADGRETVQLARYYRPTVLICELDIPPAGATDLITQVLTVSPTTRALTISAGDPRAALAALRAGAVGHIAKETDPEQLARIVEQVADGQPVIPGQLLGPLLELIREMPDGGWRPLHSRLTTREWEIIELLEKGASTHQIADQLVLSATTIYSHVKSVLRKLAVHNRNDAITAAKQLRKQETNQTTNPHTPTTTPPTNPPNITRRHTTP